MQTHNLPLRNSDIASSDGLKQAGCPAIQPVGHRLNRLILALKEPKFPRYARAARQKIRRVLEYPRFFHYIILMIILLNLVDALQTYYTIIYGISGEHNPIVAKAIVTIGLEATIILKILFVPAITVILFKYPFRFESDVEMHRQSAIYLVLVFLLVLSTAVIGNTLVILGVVE